MLECLLYLECPALYHKILLTNFDLKDCYENVSTLKSKWKGAASQNNRKF